MGSRWGGRKVSRNLALVLATYGDVCHLCGKPGADTADHLIPRSRGGAELQWLIELQRPAHRSCNSARGNRYQLPKTATETIDHRAFFDADAAGELPTCPVSPRPPLKIRDRQ